MIADPLPALFRIGAGKNVETEFEPVAEAVRNFEGFVQLVLRGVLAIDDCLAAFEGEVAVKLEHRGALRNKFGTVNLNLVAALGTQQSGGSGGQCRQ